MNIDGKLKYHRDPKLKWIKCSNCKKGKVPSNMHAYWHSMNDKSDDIMMGLYYKCLVCKQELFYNPTFDMTIITKPKPKEKSL